MELPSDRAYKWFAEKGFHLIYRSTAIRLLAHQELPGVEVRIGTGYVVIERDRKEVYRSLVREFDPNDVAARVFSGSL